MKERALNLLRTAVGTATAEFRAGQWEAIERLLQRERLLVVERTGWGKSLVYFLATRLLRDNGAGCAVLISPLLALMRNQIAAAERIGVRAETINSANSHTWPTVERALRENQVDILIISPERLSNDDFVTRCLLPIASRVGLFVVDEAHCISDWGHDFRPDYRRITRILQALPPNVPVLATTATANDRVVEDLLAQLGPKLTAIRGPLTRESLKLQAIQIPGAAERLAWLAEYVPKFPGSGIIYTLTVRDAVTVTTWLRSRGVNAAAYHADLEAEDRERLENALLRNELKALVATVALGMGFDKPDLGFVVHYQRPASVVHYYQQVGRAGRAISAAYGILLCGEEDDEIAEYFARTAFPTAEEVDQVLMTLRDADGPMRVSELQEEANLRGGKLDRVLKFLLLESPAPIRKTEEGYVRNPVPWRMPVERIDRIIRLRYVERERMNEYVSSRQCLMQFLAAELNDPAAAPCGKCAICRNKGLNTKAREDLTVLAVAFLENIELPVEPRKQWPSGIEFEGGPIRIPQELQNQRGRALSRWGHGLGNLVRHGKQHTGEFGDKLVEEAAKLIRERWHPQPQWVTCVPSRRHQVLVPDFAQRLADTLGIPFVDCLQKIRDTQPQKTRQNRFQQVRNLEGVFRVNRQAVRRDAVLLVDDMVDSRWTFTVLGYKLLEAGSGPVFPFALADSSNQHGDW